MKRKRILAVVMVLALLISVTTIPVQASTTSVHEDCLTQGYHDNYPGIHDVNVHYEDTILSSGDIAITWIDDESTAHDTRYNVAVDVSGV